MQIYIITHTTTGKQRLVEARNLVAALRHVAESDYTAERATASEALRIRATGVEVETIESK